jgi:hypothetical protein
MFGVGGGVVYPPPLPGVDGEVPTSGEGGASYPPPPPGGEVALSGEGGALPVSGEGG